MSTYGPITGSGTVTSYFPLNSAWPSTAACSSLFLDNDPGGFGGQLFAFEAHYASIVALAPTCMPPEASPWWSQVFTTPSVPLTTTLLGGYSMLCPEAFSTVYSNSTDTITTTIGCCPSSYTFVETLFPPGVPHQCTSMMNVPSSSTVNYAQNDGGGGFTTTSYVPTTPTNIKIIAVQINGFIISNPTTTTSSQSGATATNTSKSSSSSLAGTSTTANTSTSSSATATIVSPGLTSGAKGGIGTGVAVGAVAIIGLIVGILFYRRKRRQTRADAYAAIAREVPPEADSNPIHEIEAPRHNEQNDKSIPIEVRRVFELGPSE
ncbi:hypothetical protein G7Y89_g6510 [Cudoniella acicularis]|uniref:Uncharacterized protein n=1 Tax=Cudoniella acicularis TaxID=354080 RepID=A0A8H4RNQ8_9HELO|nr:hypothetical protein G7Y89_g6510 [Cudoniella acicularis]